MKLHTYINEIINIAKAQNVSWDVGADMFIANVKNAGNKDLPYYAGAGNVDFGALKEYITELENSKPLFVEKFRKHNSEIIPLRKEGKYEEVVKLMEE